MTAKKRRTRRGKTTAASPRDETHELVQRVIAAITNGAVSKDDLRSLKKALGGHGRKPDLKLWSRLGVMHVLIHEHGMRREDAARAVLGMDFLSPRAITDSRIDTELRRYRDYAKGRGPRPFGGPIKVQPKRKK